jgi:hypothetical protein
MSMMRQRSAGSFHGMRHRCIQRLTVSADYLAEHRADRCRIQSHDL